MSTWLASDTPSDFDERTFHAWHSDFLEFAHLLHCGISAKKLLDIIICDILRQSMVTLIVVFEGSEEVGVPWRQQSLHQVHVPQPMFLGIHDTQCGPVKHHVHFSWFGPHEIQYVAAVNAQSFVDCLKGWRIRVCAINFSGRKLIFLKKIIDGLPCDFYTNDCVAPLVEPFNFPHFPAHRNEDTKFLGCGEFTFNFF